MPSKCVAGQRWMLQVAYSLGISGRFKRLNLTTGTEAWEMKKQVILFFVLPTNTIHQKMT